MAHNHCAIAPFERLQAPVSSQTTPNLRRKYGRKEGSPKHGNNTQQGPFRVEQATRDSQGSARDSTKATQGLAGGTDGSTKATHGLTKATCELTKAARGLAESSRGLMETTRGSTATMTSATASLKWNLRSRNKEDVKSDVAGNAVVSSQSDAGLDVGKCTFSVCLETI